MGPIGIFDSGYGGLTVLSDIIQELPDYDYLYLGDNARAPYGPRTFDVIYKYTLEAVHELFKRDCSLIILACNTASAKALRTIQQKDLIADFPEKRVLGVIRPSAEIINTFTKTNHVGILATQGTVDSESYVIEIHNFAPNCVVHQKACPLWVPLIENNEHDSIPGREIIERDVKALLNQSDHIDTIVLACTHYPIVKSYIESIVPANVGVISQGSIVAASLKDYLARHPEIEAECSKNGNRIFLTTERESTFDSNASKYINSDIRATNITIHSVEK